MSLAPELHPASLGGGESGLGPRADLFPLVFGERSEHMKHQFRGMGIVDGDELDPALHQIGDESDVAGEPVQLRDYERGLVAFAGCEGSLEFGTVGPVPALDLGMFGDKLVF